ncbi:di-trans,poly-cis-decaprenylcistransferase [Candidatus Woesearchaeota archaeon]|nr:di-trans,poly-cis-decaprenylcistransferase [Candidatus Woesearchaeota archaeon]
MTVPKHVGIIMDGNRRFAKKLMLKPWRGHEWGAKKVKDVLQWGKELGVKELTLYAFSVENFSRPQEEFDYITDIFLKEFKELSEPKNLEQLKQDGLRIRFLGRTWMFSKDIQDAMAFLTEQTKANTGHTVNFAMAYGGRAEIIDATKKVAELVKAGKLDVDKINEDVFKQQLYTESEPDLVIRTGGEHRTSGFMLWQGWYAELYFIDDYWPDLTKEHLAKAIESYETRERRFGK